MISFRNSLIVLLTSLALVACGTIQDDEVDELTSSEIEEAEEAEINAAGVQEEDPEVTEEVVNLFVAIRQSNSQEELETTLANALVEGMTEADIAQAMGIATFRTPRKRVLISVAYVRFRTAASTPEAEIDEIYEYWSTPPRLRHPDEIAEEEEAEPEQLQRPRGRGLFSWIPGF